MRILLLIDRKKDSYDTILFIVDLLTKMIYYKYAKITINIIDLTKVIINRMVKIMTYQSQ